MCPPTHILETPSESIKDALKDGRVVVTVYGLGHVGLAISVAWLDAGAKAIGVDVNNQVVKSINNGISPLKDEPGIPEAVKRYVTAGRFRATTNGIEASKESCVKIIAVPTALTKSKKCNLSAIKQALRTVAHGLKRGDLVIVESSVPPMTTAEVAKPILENTSSLKVERDFGLAYSPERVFEGRVLEDIEKSYPKVIGGIGPKSTEAAAALYEVIAQKGVLRTTNPTVAETSKLFEGIYRDVNIALANELGRFCGSMGIDFKEVREAANSQPFCHLHLPGFVGGWCIPFYPHFVLQVANEKNIKLSLTSLARKINEGKPSQLVRVADSMLKKTNRRGLKRSKVAILGLTFRADIADTRNSPSYEVVDLLSRKEVSEINAYDPYITEDAKLKNKGVRLVSSVSEATKHADLILIMTDHSTFKANLTPNGLLETSSTPAVLVDGRNILSVEDHDLATDSLIHLKVEGFHVFVKTI